MFLKIEVVWQVEEALQAELVAKEAEEALGLKLAEEEVKEVFQTDV